MNDRFAFWKEIIASIQDIFCFFFHFKFLIRLDFIDLLICLLIDSLIDWLTDWSIDWLIDWYCCCYFCWLNFFWIASFSLPESNEGSARLPLFSVLELLLFKILEIWLEMMIVFFLTRSKLSESMPGKIWHIVFGQQLSSPFWPLENFSRFFNTCTHPHTQAHSYTDSVTPTHTSTHMHAHT